MGSDAPKTEGELGEGPPRRRTASRESQAAVARRWLTGQKRPCPTRGTQGENRDVEASGPLPGVPGLRGGAPRKWEQLPCRHLETRVGAL